MLGKLPSSSGKGAQQASSPAVASVNRSWMPSSYYSSSTFTSHDPFVSHGTRAKAFALPSQMQFHDALFYDATDSVADALEQDDLPFIETTPRTRFAAIMARAALLCVMCMTAPLYYVALQLASQHVPVLLILSLALATVATGLLVLSCVGVLGIQRLYVLGVAAHSQSRFHTAAPAVPPAVISATLPASAAAATAAGSTAAPRTRAGAAAPAPAPAPGSSLGRRAVAGMPSYFDAAALGILTSDEETPAVRVGAATGTAAGAAGADSSAAVSVMDGGMNDDGSDSDAYHLALAPTDSDTSAAAATLASAAAVATPLALTPPPASGAHEGEYSGALAAFLDGGAGTDDDALLAALSPVPVHVHVRSRTAVPGAAPSSATAAAAAAAATRSGSGASAGAEMGHGAVSGTDDSDAAAGLKGLRVRFSSKNGMVLTSVNAETPAKARGSRHRSHAPSKGPNASSGGGHSAAATALSLVTAFLTYAAPVALVLLTVSTLLAVFPAHASAYVHVRWHEALAQSAAVAPVSYAPSVAAAAWSASDAGAGAGAGAGTGAGEAPRALSQSLAPMPHRNRLGVAPSLRRSHRLVSLALRIVATVTLLSGVLVATAAGLVYSFMLPVPLPPVPAFASATPVTGVAAAVLISAGAVMDVAAGDCAHTTAVAAALARSAAAAASAASAAAASAAQPVASFLELSTSLSAHALVGHGLQVETQAAAAAAMQSQVAAAAARAHAHAALSFFWGSSERVCAHSPSPVLAPTVLLLTGVTLLALVMLNIFTLKKVFHPSRPSPTAIAAGATTSVGPSAQAHAATAPTPAHEASGGAFRLKTGSLLSWGMVSAQTRRVLAVVVALSLPVLLISLVHSGLGLQQHLLSSPAVAHDVSVKVMGAHLLQSAATGSNTPGTVSSASATRGGKSKSRSSAAAAAAVASMGPFDSIAEARDVWDEHVAAARAARSAAAATQGDTKVGAEKDNVAGVVDNLGLTSGVDTGAEEAGEGSSAAIAAAAALASEDPVRVDLARKVSHEFDKISLVAHVHSAALVALVTIVTCIVVTYLVLGAKAERIVSVTTGEYAIR